jgi:alpha-amylase
MTKFKLAFGIHNHQPVGNFAAVFEDAHQKAYLPFLTLLTDFPAIRISLHQSGILWDWQKSVHPEYYELVGKMVSSGQVELMTGGFYEPILTSIPKRDAFGQIKLLTKFLNDHFGVEASGLWLTERIWEPHLPILLAEAGIKYLPVDDTHFIYAGFEPEQLTGPFITEDEGLAVTLLPIQKRLRYLIPFGTVEEVIAELKSQAEANPAGMAIYADDGEKFGVWPDTHKHCYTDGWLRQMFEALSQESDWLEVVPLGEAAAVDPVGRAYLPTASYEEMLHWALPPTASVAYESFEAWLKSCGKTEQYGRFVRGGHWRGFLAKYEEANLMHKKMLRVSSQLAELKPGSPADQAVIDAIYDDLYASQCNCPYWHGVFGGLYLPHLRQALYSRMIKASRAIRSHTGAGPTLTEVDYDLDGYNEVLLESEPFSAVIKPSRGGSLTELCLNRHAFNLTDTLSRRREAYHLKLDQALAPGEGDGSASIHDLVLAKEKGLKELLVEDWYLKRCFIDHFLADSVDLKKFRTGRFDEDGDFVLEPYKCTLDHERLQITLSRNGFVRRPDGEIPVSLTKTFCFDDSTEQFEVRYRIWSSHPGGAKLCFAVENNFSFQAGHAVDRYILIDGQRAKESYLDSVGSIVGAHTLGMVDEYQALAAAVGSDRPAEIWHLPIHTVSLSEGGFEKVYQGTTILHRFQFQISEQPTEIVFTVHAGELKTVLEQAFSAVEMSS